MLLTSGFNLIRTRRQTSPFFRFESSHDQRLKIFFFSPFQLKNKILFDSGHKKRDLSGAAAIKRQIIFIALPQSALFSRRSLARLKFCIFFGCCSNSNVSHGNRFHASHRMLVTPERHFCFF